MDHPYIQERLLDIPATLTPQESALLAAHVAACPECRALKENLQNLERALQAQPMLAPSADFAQRWQQRWNLERQRAFRRQMLVTFIVCLGAAGLSLGLLLASLWPYLRSLELLLGIALYQAIAWGLALLRGLNLAGVALGNLIQWLPPSFWVLSMGILCQLAVLWVVWLRTLINPSQNRQRRLVIL